MSCTFMKNRPTLKGQLPRVTREAVAAGEQPRLAGTNRRGGTCRRSRAQRRTAVSETTPTGGPALTDQATFRRARDAPTSHRATGSGRLGHPTNSSAGATSAATDTEGTGAGPAVEFARERLPLPPSLLPF